MAGGQNTGYRTPRNDTREARGKGLGKITGRSTASNQEAESSVGIMKKRLAALKKLIDEETRPAQIFEEGKTLLEKVLNKIFKHGTKHPYFIFHETHFKILKAFIQAVTSQELAEEQLQKATKLATAGHEEAEKWVKEYDSRHGQKMKEFKELGNALYGATFARNVSRNYSQFHDEISSFNDLISQRLAEREGMLEGVFEVYAQLCIEEKLVQEAMKQHKVRVEKMKKSGSLGKVVGLKQEQNEIWNALNLQDEAERGTVGPNNIIRGAVGSVYTIAQRLLVEVEKQNYLLSKKI